MDEVVLDYNNRPVVTETGTVLDYIAAMVRRVKERAERMGLDSSIRFIFKMAPELWEDISNLYACSVSNSFADPTSVEEMWEARAELRAKLAISVDGVEYPVELDGYCGSDIFFMPEPKQPPWPRLLNAVLQKIGKSR